MNDSNTNLTADGAATSAVLPAPPESTIVSLANESWLRYRASLIFANLALASAAYFIAFALRFDLSIPERDASVLIATLPLLLACKFVGFQLFGLFSECWSAMSMRDLEDVVRANILGSTLFLILLSVWAPQGFPRAVFPLDFMVCTTLILAARLAVRVRRERQLRSRARRVDTFALILGAGETGIRLLQEIERRPN